MILSKKLKKLQANADLIRQQQKPIKGQIQKLEKILAGESVVLEEHEKLIIPAHQGEIQELSEGDWPIFARRLEEIKEQLDAEQNLKLSNALEKEKQKIEILFDRRDKIAEQQGALQNLEQAKEEQIEAYHSQMKKMFQEIDSAKGTCQ